MRVQLNPLAHMPADGDSQIAAWSDDRNWKWGVFYFARDDGRPFVPVRPGCRLNVGVNAGGYSVAVNWARGESWAWLGALTAVCVYPLFRIQR